MDATHLRGAVAATIVGILLAGCGGAASPPSPTPTALATGAGGSASPAPAPSGAATATPTAAAEAEPNDDAYCELVIGAVTRYNDALATYVEDALAAVAAAGLAGDMSGVNALGTTVNDLGIDARDALYDAVELADDPAARDGLAGMIAYVDSYLSPVALVMVAAADFPSLNEDLVSLTQSRMDLIEAQAGHAAAVEAYTEDRCGVEIDVMTAA